MISHQTLLIPVYFEEAGIESLTFDTGRLLVYVKSNSVRFSKSSGLFRVVHLVDLLVFQRSLSYEDILEKLFHYH